MRKARRWCRNARLRFHAKSWIGYRAHIPIHQISFAKNDKQKELSQQWARRAHLGSARWFTGDASRPEKP